MDLQFKVTDRVRLTPAAVRYYGGASGWVPEAQGGGKDGTVVFAGERPHKPGAEPRPYYVHWDNGAENSYRKCDLQAASEPVEKVTSNVIAFRRG
jgi:hypothetical protein